MIGKMASEEGEGDLIWRKNIILFLESDSEKGWIIIKNV